PGPRLARGYDPRKREKTTRLASRMKIIQARSVRCRYILLVMGAGVAELVPHRACLRVIAVGRDLHRRPRPMFVEPADRPHQLLLPAVPPQLELVRRVAMHAKLARLARADPLRPRVAQQIVLLQAKLLRPVR